MRLYYFTSEEHGLTSIRDRRIKIARIHELNDPFEFIPFASADRKFRRDQQVWKKDAARKYGLICMSASWQHPLMWGHYADKHKGICLGFEVPEGKEFGAVDYTAERPVRPAIHNGTEWDEYLIKKTVFTKFTGWRYEEEYRAVCILADEEFDPVTGHYFCKFNAHMNLSEVILGERSTVSRAQLTQVLGSPLAGISRFKARASFHQFRVEKNRNARLWK